MNHTSQSTLQCNDIHINVFVIIDLTFVIITYDTFIIVYCGSGNVREVLIFANFAKRTNLRMQENY